MEFNTYYEVAAGIIKGDFDEYLDNLSTAISQRKSDKAPKARDFKIGDPVRYIDGVRPKYLAGVSGKIVDIRRTKVTVGLDKPIGRFGSRIVTPTSLIERL